MNRFLPILLLSIFISQASFGQEFIQLEKSQNSHSLEKEWKTKVSKVQFVTFSKNRIQQLISKKSESIRVEIPIRNQETIVLNLNAVTPFDPIIKTSGNHLFKTEFEKAIHYRGEVKGKNKSLAALSFSPSGMMGIFSFGTGNFNVVPTGKLENGNPIYAIYNEVDLLEKSAFTCHTEETLESKPFNFKSLKELKRNKDGAETTNCKRVSVYLECDYKMFQDNGNSVPNTVNWVTSMFQVVSFVYAREGIDLRISEIFVHTNPDNYPTSSSQEALGAFGDSLSTRPPFNGDLAHLLSTQNNSLGGIAYLDVLCDAVGVNFGYSNIYNAFAPLPVYSWTINVVAHEIGHNFGSPHTQSCSWPLGSGNYGMLDSCYTSEGGCYSGPVVPIFGTIMSYCHLALGVDLSLGFGELPGELIRNRFVEATCLQGNVIFPPLTISRPDTVCAGSPFQLSITEFPGASYAWTGPNGFTSTANQPTIPSVSQTNAGIYTAVLSFNGCDSYPTQTKLMVDCIPAKRPLDISFCPNQVFPISFSSRFIPQSGNSYQIELSDGLGNFSTPVLVGVLNSPTPEGSIFVRIPKNISPGINYFLRIRSSSPIEIGQPIGPFSVHSAGVEPTIENQKRCGAGIVNFVGTGNLKYSWFADSLADLPLTTNKTFSTPNLSQSTSYFVESQGISKSQVGPIDVNFSGSVGPLNNYTQGLYFKVMKDLTIDSVVVVAVGTGNVVFRVRDSANTITYAQVVRPVIGNQTQEKIAIDLRLSPGSYRVDAIGSTVSNLYRSSNVTQFPFISPGLLSITHPTAETRFYWFYNWKITGLDCPGPRKKIWANIFPVPASPLVFGDSICRSGILNLNASGADSTDSYQWFSNAGNAIPGATGSSFTTPLLASTNSYRVAIRSVDNCESQKVLVQALVFPAGPSVFNDTITGCLGDSIQLKALIAGSASHFQWFNPSFSPISLTDSNFLFVPIILSDSLFHVSTISEKGCPGDTASIRLVGNPRPGAPTPFAHPKCGSGPIVLEARNASNASYYEWFTTSAGGNPIAGASDSLFTTPSIASGSVSFYVTPVHLLGCRLASRIEVIATITPRPQNPQGADSSRCGPGPITLQASGAQLGEHYHWYDSNTASLADTLTTGTNGTYFITNLSTSKAFYVAIAKVDFCESEIRKMIQGIVHSQPENPTISLQGNYLVANADTVLNWYKDGVFLLSGTDSLDISLFGNGAYFAVQTRANGCSSNSNIVVVTALISSVKSINSQVIPNPSSGIFELKTQGAFQGEIRIWDSQLKLIGKQSLKSPTEKIDLQNQPAGLYLLEIRGENGFRQVMKLVKE